jgi:hypothetical protein
MDNELNELTTILSHEQELYQRYLELLTEQQGYLVANDIVGIRNTIDRINALAQEATNLENNRRKLVSRLSKIYRLKDGEMNISILLEKLSGTRYTELEQLKQTFLDIQGKIREQKVRNELLIDQSMKMITHSMQIIHNAGNPKATYDDPSRIRGTAGNQAALISRMI